MSRVPPARSTRVGALDSMRPTKRKKKAARPNDKPPQDVQDALLTYCCFADGLAICQEKTATGQFWEEDCDWSQGQDFPVARLRISSGVSFFSRASCGFGSKQRRQRA